MRWAVWWLMFSQLRMGNTCASEGHSTALTIRNFYFNEVASEPDGDLIEVMLTKWAGKYERLERHHGFIQWLFPTRTYSEYNNLAPRLTDADITAIKQSREAGERLIRAYGMMLDFYGMELVNARTGEVRRSAKYAERYRETLETRQHNHLRVCRILSCFSVLGFRHFKEPLVRHLEEEATGRGRALKIPARALDMFRTYIREDTAEYLKFSGVKPGDETPHVLFTGADAGAPPSLAAAGRRRGEEEEEEGEDADTEPESDARTPISPIIVPQLTSGAGAGWADAPSPANDVAAGSDGKADAVVESDGGVASATPAVDNADDDGAAQKQRRLS